MITNIPQMLREGDGCNEVLAEGVKNAVTAAARELANNSLQHGLDLSEYVLFIFDESLVVESFEEVAESKPVSRADAMGLSVMLVTEAAMKNFADHYYLDNLQTFLRRPDHPFAVRLVLMTEFFDVLETCRPGLWVMGGSA